MKIALLAPIEEAVPPKTYGGIESVLYTLAETLHHQGHEVTLFASGDSHTSATLIPLVAEAIGSGHSKRLREALTYEALVKAMRIMQGRTFDIVHNHLGWQALLFRDMIKAPVVTTIHWTLKDDAEREMYHHFRDMPFISISDAQRQDLLDLNYADTIHHGLDMKRFPYVAKAQDYLAFFGRFSAVKGPIEAIRVAKATNQKLIMSGKVNGFERAYFDENIAPHIDGEQIIMLGELAHEEKIKLLGNAKALLSPIQWGEPFGLVNIESMACGTPVITMPKGSLPEIIKHGKTGFLCETLEEMEAAVHNIHQIDRSVCRAHVASHFSATRMAQKHLQVYQKVAGAHQLLTAFAKGK
jgi:glycosyltransferase involved in cell wall biosynthesis